MKLVFCKNCHDVFKLPQRTSKPRVCFCGKTTGYYEDDLNAVIKGEHAVPIGFANNSLRRAIMRQPYAGDGEEFTAFVIPKHCSTVKHE